jgi:hypothetical protein
VAVVLAILLAGTKLPNSSTNKKHKWQNKRMPERESSRHYIILPLAALIAVIPLILRGCSCGHDFDFHIINWFEAAHQFTHGTLHPRWAHTPAWNAGEPRFLFYPPISWTIGAILGLILPWTWTPIAYTWLALTAAGLSLYYLAKTFTTQNAALIAAAFYIINPYTLYTAFERTAYAELLAAAWIPLLLHAILREEVTIPRIAIPVALLWLTNAPAAVMSCYALALLTVIRITTNPGAPSFAPFAEGWVSRESGTAIAAKTALGTTLGLALAAFYIVPAAYERRYVRITMAILPGLTPHDNFLFHRLGDPDHDGVLHTASLIAVLIIVLTVIALTVHAMQRDKQRRLLISLAILTATIIFLLTPISAAIWHYLPELRFLQFPWRLLAVLAPVLSFAIALALSPIHLKPAITAILALTIAAIFSWPAYHFFQQRCYPEDTIPARLAVFRSANPGTDPTDEYTPTTADNDILATTNPPFWLSVDPAASAPIASTPGPAPTNLRLTSPIPQVLILNLRNYPIWKITDNGTPIQTLPRNDGLTAFNIPAGQSVIDITPTHRPDEIIGGIITAIALITLPFTQRRKRIL